MAENNKYAFPVLGRIVVWPRAFRLGHVECVVDASYGAESFSKDLSSRRVSGVNELEDMFVNALSFNESLCAS